MINWFDATVGVVRRDALMFLSYRTVVFTQILALLFNLTLFYFISRMVRVESLGSSDAYFAFVVVGLVIMQVLVATLGTPPGTVRQELVAGPLERFVVSPFGAVNG